MTNAVSLAQQASTGVSQGFKNRIINGAMVIDQRNAGASVTIPNAVTTYTLDRWNILENGSMVFSAQRSTTAPTGFINSLLITTTTGASADPSTRSQLIQRIEGFNIADLGWGTANAKTVTMSFWVRSSLTGQFGGALQNYASDRSYPFTYTISAANTWEYKTITIAGDTTGTWLTDNSTGIIIVFDLGMGSDLLGTAGAWAGADYRGATGDVKLSGTTNATLYLTGVQLEVGSSATSFETRSIGTELGLCQRYYELVGDLVNGSVGQCLFADNYAPGVSSTTAQFNWFFRQQKRAAPTVTQYGTFILSGTVSGTINVTPSTPICVCLYANPATAGRIYWYNNPASGFSASAEL